MPCLARFVPRNSIGVTLLVGALTVRLSAILLTNRLINSLISAFVFLATSSSAFIMPTPVFAQTLSTPLQPQSLHEIATTVAQEHGINPQTLFNMVESESEWNPKAEGDKGCSFGLVQINVCANNDPKKKDYATKTQALDPHFALEYAAQHIEDGTEDMWTSCNCYSLVWTKVGNLPHMAAILPNTDKARIGEVAIFQYTDKETGKPIKHVAYIISRTDTDFTVQEANKEHCLIDTRTIPNYDPYLIGFWSPEAV